MTNDLLVDATTAGWAVPRADVHVLRERGSRYVVLIPVINEGERILGQLRRIQDLGLGLDVVVADGGSTDGSNDPELMRDLGVRALLVKRDSGKLSAQLRMGFAFALTEGYDGVITVDGNGKDGVDAIPRFVEALDAGGDFVQGSRYVPGGAAINTPRERTLAIKLFHAPLTSVAARRRYTDTTNGFRGHSRRLLSDPRVAPMREVFDTYELLAYLPIRAARLGYRCEEVPVTRAYPDAGSVPTKIHGRRAQFELVKILWRAARGRYDGGQE
ncbi:glycosyltransferase family 2 protein [Blastococcus sp. TF02A-26]|uniref:glycosyltransferase family 2 protein n=1 Tax=Blastococcus sp. TF02A-26 TaxID=2250577 RepID=UPI000DEA052F|nr:glycosyltransferase family 2 protein [Blastococcus sp. TF02A-26]RBY89824.1 glycosyltransferase family 2 protein [Blastococcus sp. TF02A-26]